MRTLAVFYVLGLVLVVVLADLGALGGLMALAHGVPLADKAIHLSFAIGLGAVVEATHRRGGRALRWVLPIVAAEELSQCFIPGRSFDLGDLAADLAGVLAGTWIVIRLLSRTP